MSTSLPSTPPEAAASSHVVPDEAPRVSGVGPSGAPPGIGDIVEVQSARSQVPPVHAIEALVGQGRWPTVIEALGPYAEVMSSTHQLIYAIALKEVGVEGTEARRADAMSIRALAVLLDVPEESPVALLLARRMQRRNWRQAPAPKARVQVALIVSAVLIGAFVGWAWDEWGDRRQARPAPAVTQPEAP